MRLFLYISVLVTCLLGFSEALPKHIKTSSLLTCMENSQFSASFFEVIFYPDNGTALFNIDATTTISENITAKIELIVYGLNVLDESFNLCDLNEVAMCPLSAGRIDVKSSYQIDMDMLSNVPSIAYTIPDLEDVYKRQTLQSQSNASQYQG